jgi:hypothetical protein
MMYVSCSKEQTKSTEQNPEQEQEDVCTPKNPSQNTSWTGWANANKNAIQAYQEKVLQYAMILSQTPEVKNLIKDYFTSNLGNSNFSYSINIEQLINLCSAHGGQAMSRTITPVIQCGLISDSTKFGDLLNEMKGKTIGGRTITPEIFIPYYGTSLFVTPTWDGATVNRIVLNDIYAKKNVGVPVKVWNGSTWTDRTYQDAETYQTRLNWTVEFNEIPDGLRPIARCRCNPGIAGVMICTSERTGSPWGTCGFSFFGGNCTGDCDDKIIIH